MMLLCRSLSSRSPSFFVPNLLSLDSFSFLVLIYGYLPRSDFVDADSCPWLHAECVVLYWNFSAVDFRQIAKLARFASFHVTFSAMLDLFPEEMLFCC